MPCYRASSPPMPYYALPEDYIINSSDSLCSSPESHYCTETASSPALSAVLLQPSSLHARSAYEQQLHDEELRSVLELGNLPLNLSALPLLFPKARVRKNGELGRYPIIHLISLAIRGSPRQALTLSQIYETVEEGLDTYRPASGETARERKNRIQWQHSVRHSLSLQCMFEKVKRLPGDTDKKRRGAYWTLDPSKYGMTRRTIHLEDKKNAADIPSQKMKRSSTANKTSPAKPRSRARPYSSPSPQPQQYELRRLSSSSDHISQLHGDSYANFAHLPGPSMTHPRGLHDLPPMDLAYIHPIISLFTGYRESVLDSYLPYSHNGRFHQLRQYSPYGSPMSMFVTSQRGYEAEQGISPSLLHAPISSQSQESPPAAVVHGRSLRSTASRKRRDTLIPC